jgi:hypothetical protein
MARSISMRASVATLIVLFVGLFGVLCFGGEGVVSFFLVAERTRQRRKERDINDEKRRRKNTSLFFFPSHLVPQPARPRVDHHDHLPDLADAHLARRIRVVHLLDHLHLGVVISGAQSAHLRQSPLFRARRDLARVGAEHAAVLLAVLLVLGPGVALAVVVFCFCRCVLILGF